MYELTIDETTKNTRFNTFKTEFKTMADIREFLIERYGRLPQMRGTVYKDIKNMSVAIGFTYSYWNKDFSHNSKNWRQTDWITIFKITREPVDNFKRILQKGDSRK